MTFHIILLCLWLVWIYCIKNIRSLLPFSSNFWPLQVTIESLHSPTPLSLLLFLHLLSSSPLLFLCEYFCMHMYVWVYRNQNSRLCVFLNHSSSSFLRASLPMKLQLTNSLDLLVSDLIVSIPYAWISDVLRFWNGCCRSTGLRACMESIYQLSYLFGSHHNHSTV